MLYCLNPTCPQPQNPDDGKFCVNCGQKLRLDDRYVGIKLLQTGEKGRNLLGIDQGSIPTQACVIKQLFMPEGTISSDFLAEFTQNIQHLEQLGDHPEFPRILAYFIPEDLFNLATPPTIIFEKIEGESLRQQLTHYGAFSETQVKQLLVQLLPLIQAIHDQGIVHRDLNPDHLIFTPDQTWAIVDFTAAKVTAKVRQRQQGTLIGSAIYAAPEQLRGMSYPASDLYSLGVICLELLTMTHPFDLYSVQGDQWVWRDYLTTPVSYDFGRLLDAMVAERVGDRPSSATAILTQLGLSQSSSVKSSSIFQSFIPQILPPVSSPQWHFFQTLTGHQSYIVDLIFHPKNQILASAAADQNIRIWSMQNYQEKVRLQGHQNIITKILFRGDRLISGSWDYSVRVWDWRKGMELSKLVGKPTWILDLVWLENSLTLATLGADQYITLWDMEELTRGQSWYAHGAEKLILNPDTEELMSLNDHQIYVWQGDQIKFKLTYDPAKITQIKISHNGNFLITAAADQTVSLWSMEKQQCDQTFTLTQPITALAIFPNHRFFVLGDTQGTLYLWQVGQAQPTATLAAHQGEIKAIAISPDSKIIATGSADKTIQLWRFGIQ